MTTARSKRPARRRRLLAAALRLLGRLVPGSLTARLLLVFLVPTLVLGAFANAQVSHQRRTADHAATMHRSVELIRVGQQISVPLVVEYNAVYALQQAQAAGIEQRLAPLLAGPNVTRTISIARGMLDSALDDLDEQYGDFLLGDGTTIGDRVQAITTSLATQRAVFDRRGTVEVAASYGALFELAALIDAATDQVMAQASSTPSLAHINAQVQTFEDAMRWGATTLAHIVDSAITGSAGTTITDEVAASGAFSAALTGLRDILPPDRAAEVEALLTGASFTEAKTVESDWVGSIVDAGTRFSDIAGSPEAIEAISRLYEARVYTLLDLYAYGERFLDDQAAIARDLTAEETRQGEVALIWIWVSAGGSVVLLGAVLATTLLPLRTLDRHTRSVREGDLAIEPTTPSGPTDIKSLTTTFNEMVVTLRAFDSQVGRLAKGDVAIDESLPGPLGATVRQSVRRLAEVTEQLHRSEAAATLQARTDELTGLSNRTAVLERIDAICHTAATTDRPGAVVYIDLDGFKNVNDTHGHAAGDRILREIGERLRAACPDDDVARMGGDEFIVLIERAENIERVSAFAEQLIRLVEEPCATREGQAFSLTASAGITLCDGSCDALETIARADFAVYHAKERGRGRVEAYDERLAAQIETRSEMALRLRHALDAGEFSLVFQPIIHLPTGRPVAVEALLRWTRSDGRSIGPAEFIPVAERTGVITAIDDWVIGQALATLSRWAPDPVMRPLRVFVNISGRHLDDGSLTRDISDGCAAAGVEPTSIGVEITETYLMRNARHSRLVVDGLRTLGVSVAIDDFGTGYSSMSALHELAVDTIKIDQSFVAGLVDSTPDRMIVDLVVRLAGSLGMQVTAEGVDSEEKLALLEGLGCEYAQGFHLAMPMGEHECTHWLRERIHHPAPVAHG